MENLAHRYVPRLRELAAGAKPDHPFIAICGDLRATVDKDTVYVYGVMGEVFKAWGLDYSYPMGEQRLPWQGNAGVWRRRLAGAIADYIEHGTIDPVIVDACWKFKNYESQ